MDAENWSAVVGILCLVISYLVVKPLQQTMDDLRASLSEVKSTLEIIRTDSSGMRAEIEVLKRDLKAAFRYIDELKQKQQ